MTIRLHNALTRRKEEFRPIDPANVRMYVCGPTVYDRAHLGNARAVVAFDVLYRLLRHVYGPEHVTYARNFTDVDDKINARAAETGRGIREITDETIGWFHEDMDALGALRPTHEPRATEWIGAMVAMIEGLLARDHAYEAEGHVLFRVRSYAEYGALSGRSVDDMMAGARVEVAPFKEDPLDFVLWKPSDEGTPGWDSPWGRGRPGWHIECSAMARELLGSTFDIHGGGLDLQFPHHENEIAQSKCAHPEEGFARVWMHNEMLLIEDEKMSKSLGNFVTARFLLDLGVKGDAIRLVLLGTHYRKPLNWTEVKAFDALQTLRSWHSLTDASVGSEPDSRVLEALSDDLNTAEAIAVMHDLASTRQLDRLLASAQLMGLLRDDGEDWRQVLIPSSVAVRIRGISDRRINARQAKDYETADQIRQMLESIGLSVQDFAGATKVSASGFSVAPTLSDDERRSLNVSSQAENLTSTQLERFFYELLPGRVAVLEQQLGL